MLATVMGVSLAACGSSVANCEALMMRIGQCANSNDNTIAQAQAGCPVLIANYGARCESAVVALNDCIDKQTCEKIDTSCQPEFSSFTSHCASSVTQDPNGLDTKSAIVAPSKDFAHEERIPPSQRVFMHLYMPNAR